MKALLQRVSQASVSVAGEKVGEIGRGVLILFCAEVGDGEAEFQAMLKKIVGLRIFDDGAGKMNLSCEDVGGDYLLISQFTLAADTTRGKRPSYISALPPLAAEALYQRFGEELARLSGRRVARGVFGADMQVALINDGPVTIPLSFVSEGRTPPKEA